MTDAHNADDVRTAGFADECRRQIERLQKNAAWLRKRADLDDVAREKWEARLAVLIDGKEDE